MNKLQNYIAGKLMGPSVLATIKALNTQSVSGIINLVPLWSAFLSGRLANPFIYNRIALLSNYNYQLWDWSGSDEVNFEIIESRLFTWGKCAVIRINEKFIIGSFTQQGRDYNGDISVIRFVNLKGKALGNYRVGENCVLLFADTYFMLPSVKNWFGPLWRSFGMIAHLAIVYNEIVENITKAKTKVFTNIGASDEAIQSVNDALISNNNVIQIASPDGVKGTGSKVFQSVDFKDRTAELWENYNSIWSEIKSGLGLKVNSSPMKKERQINKEISVDNSIGESYLECALKQRQKGADELNRVFNLNISVKLNPNLQDLESGENTDEYGENSNIQK